MSKGEGYFYQEGVGEVGKLMKTTDGSPAGIEGLDVWRRETKTFQGDCQLPQEVFSDSLP